MLEELYEKPYFVIDFLPEQVPDGSWGQFFQVEEYYLSRPRQAAIRQRFADILLKVNCYDDLEVGAADWECWERNPTPERLVTWVTENREDLRIHLPEQNALIALNRDELCMTLYNPPEKLLTRVKKLAAAHGFFLWQPPQEDL